MKKIIYYTVIFAIIFLVVKSIYQETTKDKIPGKAKRLECQKKVTTFEKGFDNIGIEKGQKEIERDDIIFSSHIEKSKYSKSKLFEYFPLSKGDELLKQELKKYQIFNEKLNRSVPQKYQYSYYLYENDPNDPGKKNKKSKLYAGYIVFEVKNEKNKTIYKIQIDFMDRVGLDIKPTIGCAVKSFMTFNK